MKETKDLNMKYGCEIDDNVAEVMAAIIRDGGVMNSHDNKFVPVSRIAGVVRIARGNAIIFDNERYQSVNALYVEDDMVTISGDAFGGVFWGKLNEQNVLRYNDSISDMFKGHRIIDWVTTSDPTMIHVCNNDNVVSAVC